jgi:hypothetical protein
MLKQQQDWKLTWLALLNMEPPERIDAVIIICLVPTSRPPLWSSDQSSWLHNGDELCLL